MVLRGVKQGRYVDGYVRRHVLQSAKEKGSKKNETELQDGAIWRCRDVFANTRDTATSRDRGATKKAEAERFEGKGPSLRECPRLAVAAAAEQGKQVKQRRMDKGTKLTGGRDRPDGE